MKRPLALFLALLSSASLAMAETTYELKQKYPPGQTYQITRQDIQQNMQVAGQKMNNHVEQMIIAKRVISEPTDKGNKTLTTRFERLVQKTVANNGLMVLTYDTDKPADQQNAMIARAIKPMMDTKTTVVVDAQGKIIEHTGMDGIKKTAGPAGELAPSDEQMKQLSSQGQYLLPDRPVAVGETWKTSQNSSMPMGSIQIDYDVTLKEVKNQDGRQIAVLQFTGEGKVQGDKTRQIGQAKLKIVKGTVEQKGTLLFDIQRGDTESSAIVQDLSMTMSSPSHPGGGQQGMTMTTEQTMTMDVTTVPTRDKEAENKDAAAILSQPRAGGAPAPKKTPPAKPAGPAGQADF